MLPGRGGSAVAVACVSICRPSAVRASDAARRTRIRIHGSGFPAVRILGQALDDEPQRLGVRPVGSRCADRPVHARPARGPEGEFLRPRPHRVTGREIGEPQGAVGGGTRRGAHRRITLIVNSGSQPEDRARQQAAIRGFFWGDDRRRERQARGSFHVQRQGVGGDKDRLVVGIERRDPQEQRVVARHGWRDDRPRRVHFGFVRQIALRRLARRQVPGGRQEDLRLPGGEIRAARRHDLQFEGLCRSRASRRARPRARRCAAPQ